MNTPTGQNKKIIERPITDLANAVPNVYWNSIQAVAFLMSSSNNVNKDISFKSVISDSVEK